MNIAIISHTEHYLDVNGQVLGWGPTINELNFLAQHVDSITHIAPLHKAAAPDSSLPYKSNNINFVPLKPSGGKSLDKLSLLWHAPTNIIRIRKAIQHADMIQFRAPTGIGIYVLPLLRFFNTTKYWVKYAGNWKDPNMPLGNKVQKWWLRNMTKKSTKVTVNGFWHGERNNVIPFENPCLTEENRKEGERMLLQGAVHQNKRNYCFIGALNTHKGVDLILEAFSRTQNDFIGEIHFVGGGTGMKKYQQKAKDIVYPTVFHGFLPKDDILPIFEKCDFILLPSKSEGFPKVIGEAMNYGCVPLVSQVSCIDQYITEGRNGYLIEPLTVDSLVQKLDESLKLSSEDLLKMINFNFKMAEKFTYQHFLKQLQIHIFEE